MMYALICLVFFCVHNSNFVNNTEHSTVKYNKEYKLYPPNANPIHKRYTHFYNVTHYSFSSAGYY